MAVSMIMFMDVVFWVFMVVGMRGRLLSRRQPRAGIYQSRGGAQGRLIHIQERHTLSLRRGLAVIILRRGLQNLTVDHF